MTIHAYPPGSKIQLGGNNIGGLKVTVLAVLVRGTLIQYEVAWIKDGQRHSAWVEEGEIYTNPHQEDRRAMGFVFNGEHV